MRNELEEYDVPAPKPGLQATIDALKSHDARPDPTVFYGLSGLMPSEIQQLMPVWEELPVPYRRRLMRDLIDVSETNFEMDYGAIGLFALRDSDPKVREAAVEVLWEDESLELMTALVELALHDDVPDVRAAAVIALGRFIYLGELESIPQESTIPAQNAAIQLLNDENEDIAVRRRALEAISNCSHNMVPKAIKDAYHSPYQPMRVSAVYAMGRSCDDMWEDIVLQEIDSTDSEMRYEAARASGELGLVEAIPKLGQLTLEGDREILEVAIWSLGEIGSKEAIRILNILEEKAEEEGDDELLDAIEEALGNASLGGDSFAEIWLD